MKMSLLFQNISCLFFFTWFYLKFYISCSKKAEHFLMNIRVFPFILEEF